MKKLILVLNDHAKVGKSSFSAALNGYLKSQRVKTRFVAIVGNEEGDSSSARYDSTWNIIEENKIKQLFKWLERYDAVICDVESGYSPAFIDLYESEDLDVVLGEMDIELTVVIPEVEEAECHEELISLSESFADHADYVVARIPMDEFRTSLEAWEDSRASKTMDYMGAIVLEIPRVTDPVHEMLENEAITLPEALSVNSDDLSEELAEAIDEWFTDFTYVVEEAADYLLPETRTRRGFKVAVNQ